jgi:hypothetical protein
MEEIMSGKYTYDSARRVIVSPTGLRLVAVTPADVEPQEYEGRVFRMPISALECDRFCRQIVEALNRHG